MPLPKSIETVILTFWALLLVDTAYELELHIKAKTLYPLFKVLKKFQQFTEVQQCG
jgi:hypothetical protein